MQAIPSDTWVEVTHCGGSGFESHASWYYVVTGSAVYVNVGKTVRTRNRLRGGFSH